jgi:hypothetical protein
MTDILSFYHSRASVFADEYSIAFGLSTQHDGREASIILQVDAEQTKQDEELGLCGIYLGDENSGDYGLVKKIILASSHHITLKNVKTDRNFTFPFAAEMNFLFDQPISSSAVEKLQQLCVISRIPFART